MYPPSDVLVGNLILQLTCGQSSPSRNILQIPQGFMSEWGTAAERVRRQHQLLSLQLPRKPGCSWERYSGETGALRLSGLLLSTLQVIVSVLAPFFPCLLGV